MIGIDGWERDGGRPRGEEWAGVGGRKERERKKEKKRLEKIIIL